MMDTKTAKFVTEKKRALGLGSSRSGTEHHWHMLVSSILMCVAVPAFLIVFAMGLGGSHAEAAAFYGQPLPAIILALCWFVIIRHVMNEALEAIEDYVHGTTGQLTQVATTTFSYTLMAVGLFALARLAI